MPLFQLHVLSTIGFVAPPLSKSHLVLARDLVMVSYEQLAKMQVYVVRTQIPAHVHSEDSHG